MNIHPTAIVDPTAELHDSVVVGPYTIIDAHVKIGEGTSIGASCRIYARTELGKNNRIYEGVYLGCDPQHLSLDLSIPTKLVIGDGNTIREGANLHRSTKEEKPTTIGNENFIMGSVHLGHDCQVGNKNVLANNALFGGHVDIGNNIFVSASVGVHQFCSIGDYSMLGGLSKVSKDVPPYSTIDGNPAVVVGLNNIGLRRAGVSKEVRTNIHRAYKIIYNSSYTTSQAIKELRALEEKSPEIDTIIRFFENSKRGVTDYDYDLIRGTLD